MCMAVSSLMLASNTDYFHVFHHVNFPAVQLGGFTPTCPQCFALCSMTCCCASKEQNFLLYRSWGCMILWPKNRFLLFLLKMKGLSCYWFFHIQLTPKELYQYHSALAIFSSLWLFTIPVYTLFHVVFHFSPLVLCTTVQALVRTT